MGATHQRSTGYRSGTRDLFSKKFRTKGGNPGMTTYLRNFHVGDMVDIVANPAQQKGMPHKFYHGRTGKIWNVNKRCAPQRHTREGARGRLAWPWVRLHACGAGFSPEARARG